MPRLKNKIQRKIPQEIRPIDTVEELNNKNKSNEEILPNDTVEELDKSIKETLPADSKIIDSEVKSDTEYTLKLRLKCATKEEFLQWLAEYQKLSGNLYRVATTRPTTGKCVVYKAVYRCHRNTYPSSHTKVKCPSKKHTDCASKLFVTIKSPFQDCKTRSKDSLRKDYPTLVTVIQCHNHDVNDAEALKYKQPEEELQQKFLDLFSNQMGPAKALRRHKTDLLRQHKKRYREVAADRSLCPDINWVYRLYYKNCSEEIREKLQKNRERRQKKRQRQCDTDSDPGPSTENSESDSRERKQSNNLEDIFETLANKQAKKTKIDNFMKVDACSAKGLSQKRQSDVLKKMI